MNPKTSSGRLLVAMGFSLSGGLFFFSIIGVFGLPAAIGSLALFLVAALVSFRRRAEEIG